MSNASNVIVLDDDDSFEINHLVFDANNAIVLDDDEDDDDYDDEGEGADMKAEDVAVASESSPDRACSSPSGGTNGAASSCNICLEGLHSDLGVANPCGHCFHQSCFQNWDMTCRSKSNYMGTKCPICNRTVRRLITVFATFGIGTSASSQLDEQEISDLRGQLREEKEKVSSMKETVDSERIRCQRLERQLRNATKFERLLRAEQTRCRSLEIQLRDSQRQMKRMAEVHEGELRKGSVDGMAELKSINLVHKQQREQVERLKEDNRRLIVERNALLDRCEARNQASSRCLEKRPRKANREEQSGSSLIGRENNQQDKRQNEAPNNKAHVMSILSDRKAMRARRTKMYHR